MAEQNSADEEEEDKDESMSLQTVNHKVFNNFYLKKISLAGI